MKKKMMALAFMVCMIAALSASGQQGKAVKTDSGKTEITYFTFSAAPDHLKDLNQMIADFEAKNKDITVKVETASFDDYFNKLQVDIAGGVAPDVFELNYENFVIYASKGALYNLGTLADKDSSFSKDIYYPRSYNAFSYQDKQYGLPESFSTVVLYYNKDLFDKAGIAYPNENWTWNDVIAAAKKIRDPENDVWGVYSPVQFWEFYKKIAQNGGSFFDKNGNVTIDSPENVQALQTMLDIQNKYDIMPNDVQLGGVKNEDLFAMGKLGMDVCGIWMFDAFSKADFKWDITVEPGMKTKATHFFANSLAISSSTKKAEAAWKWITFFTSSDDAAKMRIKSGWELPTIQNKEAVQAYLDESNPANRQAVFDSLKYSIVPPTVAKQNEMQDGIGQILDQAKLKTITAEEALKQCAKVLEDLK